MLKTLSALKDHETKTAELRQNALDEFGEHLGELVANYNALVANGVSEIWGGFGDQLTSLGLQVVGTKSAPVKTAKVKTGGKKLHLDRIKKAFTELAKETTTPTAAQLAATKELVKDYSAADVAKRLANGVKKGEVKQTKDKYSLPA